MSFSGQISSMPLCDVVQNLVANRKTGSLRVSAEGLDACLQISEGLIVSYRDASDFDFARWLLEHGVLEPEAIEDGLRRHRRAKRKTLGRILHDAGSLDHEDYAALLRDVIAERICEVLGLAEGEFTFREGELDPADSDAEVLALEGGFPASGLVMEAARRADDWELIRRRLPTGDEVYRVPPSARDDLLESLPPEDEVARTAVALLDGTLSVRQIIARLPASRFEASQCVASLIAEKKARPLGADEIIERSDGEDRPEESISRLLAVLDREPGHREVHGRLAHLYEQVGNVEEAAKHHKVLAISYLEQGETQKARTQLSMSVELNPRDLGAWQKLWDCVCALEAADGVAAFGREFLDHFRELGLTEVVRDQLERLVDVCPGEITFQIELAEAQFALGATQEAIDRLEQVGADLVRKSRWDDAEGVFARILRWDASHEKAGRLIDEIRSGRLERRRALLRTVLRQSLAAVFLVSCVVFIIREMLVQNEFLSTLRSVLAEQVIEEERYEEAIERLEKIRESYPWSPTASGQGAALIDSLESKRGIDR